MKRRRCSNVIDGRRCRRIARIRGKCHECGNLALDKTLTEISMRYMEQILSDESDWMRSLPAVRVGR